MGVQYKDRVRGTSTTTGTGTYTVLAAPAGFQSFSALTSGQQCYYCAVLGASWEVGLGTVTIGGSTTLSRDKVLASSNANNAVNWAAGTRDVFLVNPADVVKALTYEDGGGGVFQNNLTLSGVAYIAKTLTAQLGINAAGTVGGTGDAVTAVLGPAITAYGDKMEIVFIPTADNTGAATINLNGLGAKTIVKAGATVLVAGDLKTGIPAKLVYDSANNRFLLVNPNAPTPLTLGGTGATTAAAARTALGLGTMAVVADPAPVANGGTGSNNAASARSALGAAATAHTHVLADTTDAGTLAGIKQPPSSRERRNRVDDGAECPNRPWYR
jgi:hypothetical protein